MSCSQMPGAVLLALCCVSIAPAEAAQGWSLSSGIDYSRGNYGGATATEILAVPFTARYEAPRWIAKLSLPWLQISGPANVVGDVGGATVVAVPGATGSRNASGLGDLVAGLTYNAYYDPAQGLLLDVGGKLKLATADSSKGLGTGRSDASLQLDAYKIMGRLTLIAGLGYRWMGKPPGSGYLDTAYGSLGLAWKLESGVSVGGLLDYRQAVTATSPHRAELTLYGSRPLDVKWKGMVYVYGGSTSASPDAGLGTSITRPF